MWYEENDTDLGNLGNGNVKHYCMGQMMKGTTFRAR